MMNGFAFATDNCSMPSVTYADIIIPGSCAQEYTIARTWIGEDDCGNTATCVQTISVIDTTPPMAICPPDITVECEADLPACEVDVARFVGLGGSVSDNRNAVVSLACRAGAMIGGPC